MVADMWSWKVTPHQAGPSRCTFQKRRFPAVVGKCVVFNAFFPTGLGAYARQGDDRLAR
jgi:hypothetical protein